MVRRSITATVGNRWRRTPSLVLVGDELDANAVANRTGLARRVVIERSLLVSVGHRAFCLSRTNHLLERLDHGRADEWDDARLAMIENLVAPSDER